MADKNFILCESESKINKRKRKCMEKYKGGREDKKEGGEEKRERRRRRGYEKGGEGMRKEERVTLRVTRGRRRG